MRRLLHPLLALLLSLLLLSGQQAALAHMLGHAAGTVAAQGATEVARQEDADHGVALALSHACTACIAFAAADAGPPAAVFASSMAVDQAAAPEIAVPSAPTFRFIAAFRSRAPPLL